MAEDEDDAAIAAERLEAALERIARIAPGRVASGSVVSPEDHAQAARVADITARLDGMIERLRAALGKT
ncbi:MAG TPA: hypothetical protein VFW75_03910 [Acetobacteraceae bacterium]|nr:hypothetical protein [Acetobacteraceae bacterium]